MLYCVLQQVRLHTVVVVVDVVVDIVVVVNVVVVSLFAVMDHISSSWGQ